VVAVAASDASDARATFSNSGAWLDVTAPGVSIRTTTIGGGYADSTGTSPAAPFVSGTAALVRSLAPQLTPAQVATLLALTSDDRGPAGFDSLWGWGRLDVERAVGQASLLATQPAVAPPAVTITAPQDGAAIDGPVSLGVQTTDDAAVTRVEYTVDGTVVASAGAPPFVADWNPALMSAGPHLVGATAYDGLGNRSVAAPVAVTIAGTPADCSTAGALCLAGGGTRKTDCVVEWLVPATAPVVQTGTSAPLMTCTDGAGCDQDGRADGVCTFAVGLCFDVTDARLVDGAGNLLCAPAELARFQLMSPVVGRRTGETDVANAAAVVNAVAALAALPAAGSCVAGVPGLNCRADVDCDSAPATGDGRCALRVVALAGVIGGSERCTALQQIRVPVKRSATVARAGRLTLRVAATAQPRAGAIRPLKDTDSLRLICRPPS